MTTDISTDICTEPQTTDRTPDGFVFKKVPMLERFKRFIRPVLYPVLNYINNLRISKKYSTSDFQPDMWLTDMRGNDERRNRSRVNKVRKIKGSRILVVGCGLGREVESWLDYEPDYILGIDLFNYSSAWHLHIAEFKKQFPSTIVEFQQIDVLKDDLSDLESFDIISSDAVLEHVTDLDLMMIQLRGLMSQGGVFYSGFGPLWYTWGGDHVSGHDEFSSGYNHLILDESDWLAYTKGIVQNHSDAEEGNHWISQDLFSKLKPDEYLSILDNTGLKRTCVIAVHDRNAGRFEREYPQKFESLLSHNSRLDLSTLGMVTIYQNKT
jgi:SAM-dependent methyltransferase